MTPIVSRIAKNLFKRSLEVAGTSTIDEIDETVAAEIDNVQAHHLDPQSMHWGNKADGVDGYYESIVMDGISYTVRFFHSRAVELTSLKSPTFPGRRCGHGQSGGR